MDCRKIISGVLGAVLAAAIAGLHAGNPIPAAETVKDTFGRLPAGACRAQGWIQRQMEEDGDGWVRTANQMSLEGSWIRSDNSYSQGGIQAPFYNPYIERRGAPIGAEYQAHWLDIVFRLGWVAGLDEYRRLGTRAVNDILESLDSDGYIGVFPRSGRLKQSDDDAVYELWGCGETLNALLRYHEFTGDRRVLSACLKAADWLIERAGPTAPGASEFLATQWWYTSITNAMAHLHRLSGDPKHLAMAEFMFRSQLKDRRWGEYGIILGEQPPQPQLRGHAAGWGIVLMSGLDLYRANGDAALLRGLRQANDLIVEKNLQPHGALSGQRERLAGRGPYLNTELCDVFWWAWWWTEMAALTGESRFADYAETAVLNALPGHRSKDGRVTSYFMCPNQITARKDSTTHYPARLYVECCQSNGPRTLPIIVENMVWAAPDNGLAVVYYGPSETKVQMKDRGEVILTQETGYPFEEDIRIAVQAKPAARFPLRLRIPAWCREPRIRINGEDVRGDWRSGGWARLEREWGPRDTLEINLPMRVRAEFWNNQAVAVSRGPLLYALPVPGVRKVYDKWGSFEESAVPDAKWNYALVLDEKDPEVSFKFVRQDVPAGGHVWEYPPVALEVDGRRVPDWLSEGDETTKSAGHGLDSGPRLPERPFSLAPNTERLRLVPFGFTTLRMTYLPYVARS